MQRKIKLRRLPVAMLSIIPIYLVGMLVIARERKHKTIVWNMMVNSMLKFETTYDEDLDDGVVVLNNCD